MSRETKYAGNEVGVFKHRILARGTALEKEADLERRGGQKTPRKERDVKTKGRVQLSSETTSLC